MEILSWVQ